MGVGAGGKKGKLASIFCSASFLSSFPSSLLFFLPISLLTFQATPSYFIASPTRPGVDVLPPSVWWLFYRNEENLLEGETEGGRATALQKILENEGIDGLGKEGGREGGREKGRDEQGNRKQNRAAQATAKSMGLKTLKEKGLEEGRKK